MRNKVQHQIIDDWWNIESKRKKTDLFLMQTTSIVLLFLINTSLFISHRDSSVAMSIQGNDALGVWWIAIYTVFALIIVMITNYGFFDISPFSRKQGKVAFPGGYDHNKELIKHQYINARNLLEIKQPLFKSELSAKSAYTVNETGMFFSANEVFNKTLLKRLLATVFGLMVVSLLMHLFSTISIFVGFVHVLMCIPAALLAVYMSKKLDRWKVLKVLAAVERSQFHQDEYKVVVSYKYYSNEKSTNISFDGNTVDSLLTKENTSEPIVKQTLNSLENLVESTYKTSTIINNKELVLKSGVSNATRAEHIEKLRLLREFYIPKTFETINNSMQLKEFTVYLDCLRRYEYINNPNTWSSNSDKKNLKKPEQTQSITEILEAYLELDQNIQEQLKQSIQIQREYGIQNHSFIEGVRNLFQETASKSSDISEQALYSNKTKVLDLKLNKELVPELEKMHAFANEEDKKLIEEKISEIKSYFNQQVRLDEANGIATLTYKDIAPDGTNIDITSEGIKNSLESVDYYLDQLKTHW